MALRYMLRDSHEGDARLVANSWVISYYQNNVYLHSLKPWQVYFNNQHAHISKLLAGGARVKCAVNPDDPNRIYGWMCYQFIDDQPFVHYLYVKELYRKVGVAAGLLRSIGVGPEDTVMATAATKPCLNKKYRNAREGTSRFSVALVEDIFAALEED